ncbi:HNH endonuclease [Pseudovibrio exalbescens]|uniref:HNH endonuclease n=1 Tax=Pseudovibrio exalbescens TaxID=197461 RepID=UPI0023651958|nr:HNH endonuclease [Pseudovibrio exalbescens]MDD7910593.1 HNH endonuclease [Pseudovibrio exalbescens]
MVVIETPQSFVTCHECEQLAFRNGYRRNHGETGGWRNYSSTTAQGSIWLARDSSGAWFLALDHAGVIAEIGIEASDAAGPGLARFQFASLAQLYGVMPRVYELAASLPDAPLQEFINETKNLPRNTEAERLVVQRVGQNIFRQRLIEYWQGRCPLTGIANQSLLRASHIKPWSDCKHDDERLSIYNGLLLSAFWDAAFDSGLVTFSNDGYPTFSKQLDTAAKESLRFNKPLLLTDQHRFFLEWHRSKVFENKAPNE